MNQSKPSTAWLWLPVLIGLVTPSLIIFVMATTIGGIPLGEAARDVVSRQFAEGHSLFLVAALGLVPFLLLAVLLVMPFRSNHQGRRVPWLSAAGTAGALAFMIPAHVSVWLPLYTNTRMSSTAVIAFLFIPFICCLTMGLGLLVGALATRRLRPA